MLLKNHYFRFSLTGTVLAIAGVALFSSLGVWQSYRAVEKQRLQDEFDSKNAQQAFVLNEATGKLEDRKFLRVEASGHYDRDNERLIDNTVYQGSAGYYVMTPFVLDNTKAGDRKVIMVNRGWVPVGRDRNQLPELQTPGDERRIRGQLAPPKSKPPLILGELPVTEKVWPYFDMEKYRQHTGYHLLPLIILLDKNEADGYVRDWPKYETRVGMHIGYAIQWFTFALIVVATYFGLNIKKRETQEQGADPETEQKH